MTTHPMAPTPEIAPGNRDYWQAVTDVPCPSCEGGMVRWAEAGHVPGCRICDGCGKHFIADGDSNAPSLTEQDS